MLKLSRGTSPNREGSKKGIPSKGATRMESLKTRAIAAHGNRQLTEIKIDFASHYWTDDLEAGSNRRRTGLNRLVLRNRD